MNKPIGALVTFAWVNTDPPVQDTAYFSFGTYDEVTETDSFGVPDTRVFYYVDGGEAGLKEMMDAVNPPEFEIVSYELTYPSERVMRVTEDSSISEQTEKALKMAIITINDLLEVLYGEPCYWETEGDLKFQHRIKTVNDCKEVLLKIQGE
jgi:hypothetical protein